MARPEPKDAKKQFHLAPGEEWRICPYDPSHIITNVRLGTHLVKCRRNYEKQRERAGLPIDMILCRFNSMHILPRDQIGFHESRCANQHTLVRHFQYAQMAPSAAAGSSSAFGNSSAAPATTSTDKSWDGKDSGPQNRESCPWSLAVGKLDPKDRLLPRAQIMEKLHAYNEAKKQEERSDSASEEEEESWSMSGKSSGTDTSQQLDSSELNSGRTTSCSGMSEDALSQDAGGTSENDATFEDTLSGTETGTSDSSWEPRRRPMPVPSQGRSSPHLEQFWKSVEIQKKKGKKLEESKVDPKKPGKETQTEDDTASSLSSSSYRSGADSD